LEKERNGNTIGNACIYFSFLSFQIITLTIVAGDSTALFQAGFFLIRVNPWLI
jgi:hypothetical protein